MNAPLPRQSPADALEASLFGASVMGEAMRAVDWSASPLGAVAQWPQSLKTVVRLMLDARVAMWLAWGPELTFFCNDAHRPALGVKQHFIGAPASRVWAEIWPEIGPRIDRVLASGQATWDPGLLLFRERSGVEEETRHSFSYSPVHGDSGRIEGMLCVVTEHDRTLPAADGEQALDLERARAALASSDVALRESEARLRLLVRITEQAQRLADPLAVMSAITALVGQALGVDRCVFANIDADAATAEVFGTWVRGAEIPQIQGQFRVADFGAEPVRLLRAGEPFAVEDVENDARLAGMRPACRAVGAVAQLSVGVLEQGRLVAGLAVHQGSPRRWSKADVQLMQSVATPAWEALERARARHALVQSEMQLREMAEAMPQIVYVTGADGRIEFVNRQWQAFTGQLGADAEHLPAVVHPDDLAGLASAWQRAAQHGAPVAAEFRLRRADGEYRWFLTRSVPVRDGTGQVVRWYGTSTNIDFQKRHADALKRAQDALQLADRRKDEFLATLAHELRNPLAPLRNAVHLLQMSKSAETAASVQPMMRRQIDHLVRLVDDLLEVSRISSGKLELQLAPVVLGVVLAGAVEAARPFLDAGDHVLEVDIAGDDLVVNGDVVRLTQVFVNLLNNAAKYSEQHRRIRLSARQDREQAVVEVKDDGVGMSATLLPRVFDLFVQGEEAATRAQGGLGIGLSLVKSLLALHGGSIEARSDGVGHGSTFVVRLPLWMEPGTVPDAGAGARGRDATPLPVLRVLVCDDNQDAATSLGELLRFMGAQVSIVHRGTDAIAAVSAQRPDLILLDLGMPGMDGFEVARQLRSLPAGLSLQIVALTGWGQDRDRERTLDAGFDRHLVKPVDLLDLQDLVNVAADRIRTTTTTVREVP